MDKVIENIKSIALKYPAVNKVLLFGSRARGDHNEKSDYDIAVVAPGLNASDKVYLTEQINQMNTLHKIDLVIIEDFNKNSAFYENIKKDGIVLMDKFTNKAANYKSALVRLHESIEKYENSLDLVVRDGVIQRFEFTTELAWKTIREYLLTQQVTGINTPRAVLTEAFTIDLIADEEGWLQIMQDRNVTSHVYDEDDVHLIYNRIAQKHIVLFDDLQVEFDKLL